jgi:hypothetical protein
VKALEQSLSSLTRRRAVALCNNLPLARSVADDLRKNLGVDLTVKRLDQYTDLRSFIGDPRNPVSYELSDFYHLIQNGGLVLFEVVETSAKVIENLQLLEPLLPRGGVKWRIPDYANFRHIEVHPNFYIVVSLPLAPRALALPPSLSSRLDIIELSPSTGIAKPEPTMGPEIGPSNVLILMKFGVEKYEQWYKEVLQPLVEKLGTCFRMEGALEDWQSDVTRAIDRADAIIVDLSHDLINQFSRNVLWELNRLWQSFRTDHPDGVMRKKMVFVARGLGDIASQHPQNEYIYSSEIGENWIADMPTSASNIEDLLGFEIRRYEPTDKVNLDMFKKWLEERLSPLVQNIPAPITDSELRQKTNEFHHAGMDTLESRWLRAISERDFKVCDELADSQDVPLSLLEFLGDLITTVTVSQAVATPGYWSLAKKALSKSSSLRAHYQALLATKQLSLADPFTSNFCENVWLAFTRIDRNLPIDEKKQLAELAMKEKRMYIREVSDHFRYAHLPEDQQRDAMARLIMEHMMSAQKKKNI